jgi:NAD(P)H-hydrate repair Nnr-like enzyme with NAD(P)H-hydrate dehydratase domain
MREIRTSGLMSGEWKRTGPKSPPPRHHASMVIDGDDLQILSRSGDERASNPHNGNIITAHRIERFRELVY